MNQRPLDNIREEVGRSVRGFFALAEAGAATSSSRALLRALAAATAALLDAATVAAGGSMDVVEISDADRSVTSALRHSANAASVLDEALRAAGKIVR